MALHAQGESSKRAWRFWGGYTVLFAVTFLAIYSPFLAAGKSLVWDFDGKNQYYPALIYIGQYIRSFCRGLLHGDFSLPMFDWHLGLGSDVIWTMNYYGFGDPLNLFAAVTPVRYTELLYNGLIVLRLYLAGLAFSALCFSHRKREDYTMIGALMYVFSGYVIYYSIRYHEFINPMMQFPLLVLGIDQVLQKKRSWVLIVTVCWSALCGFYFLFMMTVMLGLYVVIRFLDCSQDRGFLAFCRLAGQVIRQYSWGIGLSAVFLIPSLIGLMTSSRAGGMVQRSYFSYGWAQYLKTFLQTIAPPAGRQALVLAAIALFAVPCLLLRRKEHRALKWMLGAGLLIYLLPLGGYVMNGMSYPSQRWSFGFVLLISFVVVEMLPLLLTMQKREKWICAGVLLVYLGAVLLAGGYKQLAYPLGAGMLAVTFLVLLCFGGDQTRLWNRGAVACLVLVLVNVSVNGIFKYSGRFDQCAEEFSAWGTRTAQIEGAVEREAEPYLQARDGRFDSSHFSRNVSAVWGVPSVNAFWSIFNKHVTDFWLHTENSPGISQKHNIYSIDHRSAPSTLISTKYFIEKEDSEQFLPFGYDRLDTTQKGYGIYQNRYALPWGYTYDAVISYDQLESMNALEKQETMLQAIALGETPHQMTSGSLVHTSEQIDYTIVGMEGITWQEDGTLIVEKDQATMTLAFEMPQGVEGYLRFRGLDSDHSGISEFELGVASHGVEKTARVESPLYDWYFGRKHYLFNLGYREQPRTTCTITFPLKGTFSLEGIELYSQPMEHYPDQIQALRAEPLENIVFGTNTVSGTVDLSEDKVLCLSIPYGVGWMATVDGDWAKILCGNYMFTAIPLRAGHHKVVLTYCTPGIRLGAALSLTSLVCVFVSLRRERKSRRAAGSRQPGSERAAARAKRAGKETP